MHQTTRVSRRKQPTKAPELVEIGAAIKRARVLAGLSQEALAASAGLDRSYIGGIERGERNVAVVNLVKIARALGAQPSSLLATIR
jgi:transcriptional regulator with XRE-family HTH domain